MIDWELTAIISGATFGIALLVQTILCVIIWVIGLIMQISTRKSKN